jgi:hypothetical protein
MRPRHLAVLAALLAWQAVPERSDTSPSRRFALSLGYGSGDVEDYHPAQLDCDGNVISPARSERVRVRSVGARADMITRGGLRLTAFGGNTTSDRPGDAGASGGFQMAWEGGFLGIGAGPTVGLLSSGGPIDHMNLYLRIGRLDGQHFRVEVLGPTETYGLGASEVRVGAGVNQGLKHGASGYAGVGVGTYGPRIFGDFSLPLGSAIDVMARGQVWPGHEFTEWSLGLGARYRFAR